MSYTIQPITLGTNCNIEKSAFLYRTDCGTKITAAYMVFLLQNDEHNILVDSGAPAPHLAEKMSFPQLSNTVYLKDEIEKRGLSCNDIDTVILTHLHWDHCYNLELFPKARVLVQKKELQHAVSPSPYDSYMYVATPGNGLPGWMTAFQQLERISGDCNIYPGIDVILTPGHTPGQMSVIVEAETKRYALVSDLMPLYENYERMVPNGISVSFPDFYSSYEKIRALNAEVIPGHDIRVSEREVFR